MPKHIKKRSKPFIMAGLLLVVVVLVAGLVHGHNFAVLNPAGQVASKERNLMFVALALSVLVVVPVFVLTGYIAWKYRAGNHRAAYQPNWDHSRRLETIWWTVPALLIAVLAVITWNSSHDLDPYKPLVSTVKPVTVQVVALDWKWLFIYPEDHIASVNFMDIPVDTPVNLQITADAPMNSLWIPQLGGQVYAMSGMTTQLHLNATKLGDYSGMSANISGVGFSGMRFVARASSGVDHRQWVDNVKAGTQALDADAYAYLARPSTNNPVTNYASVDDGLYQSIQMKYMSHGMSRDDATVSTTVEGAAR